MPAGLLEEVEAHVGALEEQRREALRRPRRPAARLRPLRRGDLDAGDDGHDPQRRPRRRVGRGPGGARGQPPLRLRLVPAADPDVRRHGRRRRRPPLRVGALLAEARARGRAGRRADRRRPRRARRALQGDLRGLDRPAVPAGRARAARTRGRGRVQVVGHAARPGVPPRARDPGRPRHGRERRPDGVRQQGRDLGDRRRVHARPVHRRARDVRRVPRRTPRARTSSPASARRCRSRRWRTCCRRRWRSSWTPPGGSRSTTGTCRTSSSRSRRARSTCCRRARPSAPRLPRCGLRATWSTRA